jgi:hypothetical protein
MSDAMASITAQGDNTLQHMQSIRCGSEPKAIQGSTDEKISNNPNPPGERCENPEIRSEGMTIDVGDCRPVETLQGTTELISAVRAALEAAYGSDPITTTLLARLCQIFNDGTFISAEEDYFAEQSNLGDGFSCYAGAPEGSSVSGTPSSFATGASPNTNVTNLSFSGTSTNTGYCSNGGRPENAAKRTPENAIACRQRHRKDRVHRRLRCHFNARYPHQSCANRSADEKDHRFIRSGYLSIQHLK